MGEPRGAWTKPPTPWTSPKVWAGLPGLPEVWAPCPPPAHTGCEEASRRPHGHPPSPEKPVPSPPRHYRPGPQLPSPGKRAGHSDTDVPPSPWRGPVPLVLLDVLPRPWPPARRINIITLVELSDITRPKPWFRLIFRHLQYIYKYRTLRHFKSMFQCIRDLRTILENRRESTKTGAFLNL